MNCHKHLILISPHFSGGGFADFKCLLRCDLAFTETLYPVITYDLATQTEPPLYGNHFGIGILI